MKILDTKKAKEQREVEHEQLEFEKWLKEGLTDTTPPTVDDLKQLFDDSFYQQAAYKLKEETLAILDLAILDAKPRKD